MAGIATSVCAASRDRSRLLKYRQAFNPEVFKKEEEKMKRKKLMRLKNMAAAVNHQLIPAA
jgi:hypothetical protein